MDSKKEQVIAELEAAAAKAMRRTQGLPESPAAPKPARKAYKARQSAKPQVSTQRRAGRPREQINPGQLEEIMARWQRGEKLKNLAKEYGIPGRRLGEQTAAAREAFRSHSHRSSVTMEQLETALWRWHRGETLDSIAKDMKIPRYLLDRLTKGVRRAVRRASRSEPPLTDAQLEEAGARWRQGQDLAKIAHGYGVSVSRLWKMIAAVRRDALHEEAKPATGGETGQSMAQVWQGILAIHDAHAARLAQEKHERATAKKKSSPLENSVENSDSSANIDNNDR